MPSFRKPLLIVGLALVATRLGAGSCDYAPRVLLATVDLQPGGAQGLVENSGLAHSRTDPRLFWALNDSDSGGAATGRDDWAFAIGATGETLNRFRVTLKARDPEDLAVGPGPETGVSYVYWGEIGDNSRRGNGGNPVRVWRFPEPPVEFGAGFKGDVNTLPGLQELRLRFPSELDGQNTDLETLMVDPEANLYVVTKRTNMNERGARLYMAPFPQSIGARESNLLRFVADFPLPPAKHGTVVGGDINRQGNRMILLSREDRRVYIYERHPGETWAEAIEAERKCSLKIDFRPQLEAVAWDAEGGRDFYTLSEGARQPIYRFRHAGDEH